MKKTIHILTLLLALTGTIGAQEIHHLDTIQAPIVGFHVGGMVPSDRLSWGRTPDGDKVTSGSMFDLYTPPYLNFGLDFIYKFHNNWMLSFDGNLFFGNDNLRDRVARMDNIFTQDSIIVGTNGTDATVTCYNRGLAFKVGAGKLFPLSSQNPNAGLFGKIAAGWVQHQSVFFINEVNAPQIDGDYALLYDHQRRGFTLNESFGYMFMSNHRLLANFYVALELNQYWMHSTRDYILDHKMGLHGPDKNKYFDFSYSLKLCWMIPLTGKPSYDYYYF